MARRAAVMLSVVLAACAIDPGASVSPRCESSSDCPLGGACYRGFCIASQSDACAEAGVTRIEDCDGADDDCDGRIDEAVPSACYPTGLRGCVDLGGNIECTGSCATGVRACVGGESGACEGAIVPAASDGCTPAGTSSRDDDCDGTVDEDCTCIVGSVQPCYGGPEGTSGVGACTVGVQTCVLDGATARFGECAGMRTPTPETCANDGVDDDCNGSVDDVAGLGDACAGSQPGVCGAGLRGCQGDELACVTPRPTEELCNTLDDDCDGRADEPFDLQVDERNCGACGHACEAGFGCCAGTCVDLMGSITSCGECGRACASGSVCCRGSCADLDTSRSNCGACGHRCGGGESCVAGTCCEGDPDRCT